MRQREKHDAHRNSYKVTVRALESLIRLSEAMARAHCDRIIRPSYVREVCRLLRNSNINISKSDIEFETIQEEINREQQQERMAHAQAQFEMQRQSAQTEAAQDQAQSKKVKISWDEYQKLSYLIVGVMKEYEQQGMENVQQADIINRMVQKLEVENTEASTSIQRSIETSKKVSNVISHLISKENVLMVSQDSKIKNERYLCLNINVDFQNMSLAGNEK